MIRKQNNKWINYLSQALKILTNSKVLPFLIMTPSKIPAKPGVYMISVKNGDTEIPYYVGRSKNLRRRLYNDHLMGPLSNARLKKYLIRFKECNDLREAKKFIKEKCLTRWFLEKDYRKRGAVEGYVVGITFPKYGIYEEH